MNSTVCSHVRSDALLARVFHDGDLGLHVGLNTDSLTVVHE